MSSEQNDCEASPTRRKFLKRTLLGGGASAAGALLYTWRVEPHWVEVVQRPLPIASLPDALVGKRLVQLSDLHVGPIVDQEYLIQTMSRVADLQPDALAITGDFMTCRGSEQVDRVAEVIGALPEPPLGSFAVLGNHDYGRDLSRPDAADRLASRLDGLGVRVLRNEVTHMGDLQVLGADDFWTNNFHPELAVAKYDPGQPAIALCHNPDGVDRPEWRGYRGWILAGHTHGGQCKPPLLPPPLLPVRNRMYTSGEFAAPNGCTVYVNRGVGYLHRVRFNCRPEITVFELTRAV